MMKKILCAMAAFLLLAGCGKVTSIPQNQAKPVTQTNIVILHNVPEKERDAFLAGALCSRPGGEASAVVTMGAALPKDTKKRLAATLARYGIAPEETQWKNGEKGQLEVAVTCLYLEQVQPAPACLRYWFSTDAVSPGHGAATELNYSRQMTRKRDYVTPDAAGDPNPLAAVGAVERYQKGESRGIVDQSIQVGTMGD